MNDYRGEALITLSGQDRTLRYSWGAVLELRNAFGADFDDKLTAAIVDLDLETVACFLAIGLKERWPDVTPADVLSASPPVAMAIDALKTALQLAFHGPQGVTAKPRENPLAAAKSRLTSIWYRLVGGLRSQPA